LSFGAGIVSLFVLSNCPLRRLQPLFNIGTKQSRTGNDEAFANKSLCKAMRASEDWLTLPMSQMTRSGKLPSFLMDRLAQRQWSYLPSLHSVACKGITEGETENDWLHF
jgi:hypothetical protein